jgi:hypothetical protein
MPVHESRLVSMIARLAGSHEIELFSVCLKEEFSAISTRAAVIAVRKRISRFWLLAARDRACRTASLAAALPSASRVAHPVTPGIPVSKAMSWPAEPFATLLLFGQSGRSLSLQHRA